MTLAALHLIHSSIDLHNLTGEGQGESGPRGTSAESRPSPVGVSATIGPLHKLAERGGRDGRAPLVRTDEQEVRCFGVQQERAEHKSPRRRLGQRRRGATSSTDKENGVTEGPYNGGINLTTLEGRPSAGVDVRGANGIVHLTTTVNAQRGCTQSTVELFDEGEIDDLIIALRFAKERAFGDLHKTGAAA